MSVVAEVRVSADEFELGRLFEAGMRPDAAVELETMVPAGNGVVPYFRLRTEHLDGFLDTVREEAIVEDLRVVDDFGGRALLAFDWEATDDPLFGGVLQSGVAVLDASGRGGTWTFELRFDGSSDLDAFREHCVEVGIDLDLVRMRRSSSPGFDLSFGLTGPQHEALALAVDRGYYDVPRRCTTAELAVELGISDQAVSERLRRGVFGLVRHTVHPEGDGEA